MENKHLENKHLDDIAIWEKAKRKLIRKQVIVHEKVTDNKKPCFIRARDGSIWAERHYPPVHGQTRHGLHYK